MITSDSTQDELVKVISELPLEEASMVILKAKMRREMLEQGRQRVKIFDDLMQEIAVIPKIYAERLGITVEEFQSLNLADGVE
jgi:hypothetical protein